MVEIAHWSNGKPFAGLGDCVAQVTNPATGVVSGQVRLASVADARLARQQGNGAWHQAAAEHSIQFVHAGRASRRSAGIEIGRAHV